VAATVGSAEHFACLDDDKVPASDDQVNEFQGTLSPMLTVWRKIHLEFECMLNPGFAENTWTGTWGNLSPDPQAPDTYSWIDYSIADDPATADNHWEFGGAKLESGGQSTYVLVYASTSSGEVRRIKVKSALLGGMTSGTITLGDDDFFFGDTYVGVAPAAFILEDAGAAVEMEMTAGALLYASRIYGAAYVAFQTHPQYTDSHDFEVNASYPYLYWCIEKYSDEVQDMHRSDAFWAVSVALLFQASSGDDGDPNGEQPWLKGVSHPYADNDSTVVFVGACHEQQKDAPGSYDAELGLTVAHEIGHLYIRYLHSSRPQNLMVEEPDISFPDLDPEDVGTLRGLPSE
jgi:hypothetical protein